MNKEAANERNSLLDLLALDSIYQKLSWYDRAMIHMILNHSTKDPMTERAKKMYIILINYEWTKPYMKYPEWQKDVLHFETPEGIWEPVENYRILNENLTKQINLIWEKP